MPNTEEPVLRIKREHGGWSYWWTDKATGTEVCSGWSAGNKQEAIEEAYEHLDHNNSLKRS